MRKTTLAAALSALLATSLAAGGALADSLSLVCHVKEVRGAAHHDFKRRLDMDLTAKTVRISDDIGHGWEFKRAGPLVSVDPDLIRIESGGGKDSSIDRHTASYVFHNQKDRVTISGHCDKTDVDKPKF
jgi:hypothetical protein